MYPMDFEEFCLAMENKPLVTYIRECFSKTVPLERGLHEKAMQLFREYMLVGGMPQSIVAYIDNERDFIYYCNNCNCTQSNGEKTFCHKWTDKREYCKQESGKEYNFFIRINGLNELNLMNTNLHNKNYYKLIGRNYYLEDDQEILPLKFSSNSRLIVNYEKRHKVNLNELLIQYSFNGDGEFYTNNNKKLNNSGKMEKIFILKN